MEKVSKRHKSLLIIGFPAAFYFKNIQYKTTVANIF